MSLPIKTSNSPTNAAAGVDPSASVVATASTTGGGSSWPPPGWMPPWQQPQPTINPNPVVPNVNPYIPPISLPYVPDTIITDGTGSLPMHPMERLFYILGIVVFTYPTTDKCSSCSQTREIVIAYGRTIHRQICRICATRIVDKIFDVKVDAELESILYDKTDTK